MIEEWGWEVGKESSDEEYGIGFFVLVVFVVGFYWEILGNGLNVDFRRVRFLSRGSRVSFCIDRYWSRVELFLRSVNFLGYFIYCAYRWFSF